MPHIQTFSNVSFDLAQPKVEQVRFVDIVHALAHLPRFTGHSLFPYTVMQHSLEVSRMVGEWTGDPLEEMRALLHDAHEVYTNDLSGPKKELLPAYCVFEDQVAGVVARYFRLPTGKTELGHRADMVAVSTEYHQLFTEHPWVTPQRPAGYRCAFEDPMRVRVRFMRRYLEITDRIADPDLRAHLYGLGMSVSGPFEPQLT